MDKTIQNAVCIKTAWFNLSNFSFFEDETVFCNKGDEALYLRSSLFQFYACLDSSILVRREWNIADQHENRISKLTFAKS